MRRSPFPLLLSLLCLTVAPLLVPRAAAADDDKGAKIKALIVDGQNNHAWQKTTPVLKAALESGGLFTVDVATSPPHGQKMDDFKPDFSKYGVVVSNYNGDDWPEGTRKAFEEYVKNGGGFVSVHAADNSFPKWAEYNKMIAVGGWGGRNEKSGPMLRWKDGKLDLVPPGTGGGGGTHGKYFSFPVETVDTEHPITKGLPAKWMHAPDELYATLRGPAENVTVLAVAKMRQDRRERANADGHRLRQGPRLPHDARPQRRVDEGRRLRRHPLPRRRVGGHGEGHAEGAGELPDRRQGEQVGRPRGGREAGQVK